MEDLPAGLPDHDLRAGLARFRWFTSVSDLTTKPLAALHGCAPPAGCPVAAIDVPGGTRSLVDRR
ncbi:hypothetical protein OG205_14745 [Lentzea sp. NBC_00516]|uniref:hypothetical protein n=1 Tax=Lentzea sp. NBC_00516 TaxID=2903582 RepID=UPI002E80DA3E|nr:hypothetical protein [Lentzea sp. NBC_00516]WUD28204.1 hypothetical protein OG205_14745 [Lentzea sp. NBC_00516]